MASSGDVEHAQCEDELVPCEKQDFLDQDPPIRGQRFACLSFVSPEDTLANKEAFVMRRFLDALGKDVQAMLDNVEAKYGALDPEVRQSVRMVRERHGYLRTDEEMQDELRAFRALHGSELDEEFAKNNGFRTSVRGIKIRGVYETLEEASVRAQKLKKRDPRFDIFISEVGCWCPWSPDPEHVKDSQHAETQLNTLVKKYQEVQELRDEVYEQRKKDMLLRLVEERDMWVQARKAQLCAVAKAEEEANALTDTGGEEAAAVPAEGTTEAGGEEAAAVPAEGATEAGGEEAADVEAVIVAK